LRGNGLVAGAGAGRRARDPAGRRPPPLSPGPHQPPRRIAEQLRRPRSSACAASTPPRRSRRCVPLVSREGSVTGSRNSIIVADFADNIARIRQIVASIDRDNASTRVLALQNAGAREIAEALTALTAQGSEAGRGAVSIVPIDSSNSIALRGDAATVARMVEIARDLDRRAATGTELRVIFLEHADAEQLLPVLQQLLGQAVTAPASTGPSSSRTQAPTGRRGASGGNAGTSTTANPAPPPAAVSGGGTGASVFGNKATVVTRFEGANAIVIAAPKDVQRQLGEVIRQLDQRRPQVLSKRSSSRFRTRRPSSFGVQLLLAGTRGSNIPSRSPTIRTPRRTSPPSRARSPRRSCAPTPQPSTARW
jgi:general secretion pathway protein D